MEQSKLEFLKRGRNDQVDFLKEDDMDLVLGGVKCKRDYDASKHYCGCKYEGPAMSSVFDPEITDISEG